MAREARVSAGGAAGDGGGRREKRATRGGGQDGGERLAGNRAAHRRPHPPPLPAGRTGEGDGLVLALDAGSPIVSVAVGRGGEVLAAGAVTLQRSSTQLLALVAEVLEAAAALPADLAGVVALAGPGSFTGLRVGLATALGLVQGLGVRAQAVPTLAALAAASEAPPGGLVIAAVDALRGEWSAQAFKAGPVPEALGEMALVPAGELLERLAPWAAAAPAIAPSASRDGSRRDIATGDERRAGARPADASLRDVEEGSRGQANQASTAYRAGTADRASVAGSANLASSAPPEIIAFGVEALRRGGDAAGGWARFQEAPPLAPAALRLAAALPPASWRAASLAAPIYSRPPATTTPKPRPGSPPP